MAAISSVNVPERPRVPGSLDGNIMVLIYAPDCFEPGDITIVDFADDFVAWNRLHGMVVSRLDIEFYWSFGVRGAFKHGDPQQELLLGQMNSPFFEEYLISLTDTRNGQGFGKGQWKKESRIEKTLDFQPDVDIASNKSNILDEEAVGADPLATHRESSGNKQKKKKRRRKCRKNRAISGNSGETAEEADAVSLGVSALDTDIDQFKDTLLTSQVSPRDASPDRLIKMEWAALRSQMLTGSEDMETWTSSAISKGGTGDNFGRG